MKLNFLFVGKTSEKYIEEGNRVYLKRLNHYLPSDITVVPAAGVTGSREVFIKKESAVILKKITERDFVVLLDEKGKEFSSMQLSSFMNKAMVNGTSRIVFMVGGAFGVSEEVAKRANLVLSFSKFTMTHQMIRIFLLEQVYRAMTIIRNESYHHA
ncbi:MAG: 23S rRNA (pseudouridine(1915)-N(3))-methyltransferase RlmH [Bacteroidetes bacterium]|nr:23S rRNA (pseudouridine(1915)-N(3))-methyltransferase RlmH [Bacteroidota bacterium]